MAAQSEHSRSVFRNNLRGEDAYSRHVRYVTQFQNVYGASGSGSKQVKRTEMDGLVEKHRFLRDDDDKELNELSPDDQIAVKYYRGLFKEFALVDLKHYKSGQFALRWRTEPEVLSGLGQFTCGNTRCAYHQAENDRPVRQPKLITLELPFGYVEEGEAKQALVKASIVVLCERCNKKLMWKRNKEREEGEGPEEDQAEPELSSHRGDSSKREREGCEREKDREPSSRNRDRRDRERKHRHERSRSRSPRRGR